MFRGEVETAVRSGTKSSFSVMGFQHKDAIYSGLVVFLFSTTHATSSMSSHNIQGGN